MRHKYYKYVLYMAAARLTLVYTKMEKSRERDVVEELIDDIVDVLEEGGD